MGCTTSGGIYDGQADPTCNVNSGAHTFQVCATAAGGSPLTLNPSGTSSKIVAWPRTSLYWIVTRTSDSG